MKVTIDRKGLMEVSPETELEEYALELWSRDYFHQGHGEASFMVHSSIYEDDEGGT